MVIFEIILLIKSISKKNHITLTYSLLISNNNLDSNMNHPDLKTIKI